MLKVEIKDTQVTTRQGTNDQGQNWKVREQQAYVFVYSDNGLLSAYPDKMTIRLTVGNANLPDQPPYAAGTYYIDPSCFYIGQYNRLSVGTIKLIPEEDFKKQFSNLKVAA